MKFLLLCSNQRKMVRALFFWKCRRKRLSEFLSCSTTTRRFSDPKIRTLWRFTFPFKLKVASSLKIIRWQNCSTSSLFWRTNVQNSILFCISPSWRACNNWILYCLSPRHLRNIRQTVFGGIASSLDAWRTDFCWLLTKLCRICSTFSSEVLGLPYDFPLHK